MGLWKEENGIQQRNADEQELQRKEYDMIVNLNIYEYNKCIYISKRISEKQQKNILMKILKETH